MLGLIYLYNPQWRLVLTTLIFIHHYMATVTGHLYHLVAPSPWPLVASIGAFFFTSGLVFFFHRINYGLLIFFLGFLQLLLCMYFWFRDVAIEATYLGYHTKIVRNGLKMGFLFFLVSEIMLFFGFFWAFFHLALDPSIFSSGVWPPVDIVIINPLAYPLFNTLLLLTSSCSVTWAHRSIAIGSFKETIDAFLITLLLGFSFVVLQAFEYYAASFNFSDSAYASVFYCLTGLHGFHVIVGALFLLVCFIRLLCQHFSRDHYLGFVCAIWYWHFVDVVWVFLFISVYLWTSY